MYLKDIQAKGIFKIRIQLVGAFKQDPEKNPAAKKARAEIASFTALVAAYEGGADRKALAEAQENLRVWNGILVEALAEIQAENEGFKEFAEAYQDEWILLREPTGDEVVQMEAAGGTGDSNTKSIELFESCLIDWSMEREAGKKASREEVLGVLKQSSSMYSHIAKEWGASLPLAKRSGRASVAPLAR